MEYYFDTDDKLERKKYAEFLKSMLENCDKYRREDSDGAYVIAIDSPWGTGKTRFAKMLRNYLEDRTRDMKDDSLPGKNASFNAIYYNSWETDFSDDALLPLIYSITKSPEFRAERFKNKSKAVLGKFLDAAAAITKATAYTILHNFAGEKVVEMIEAGGEALTKKAANPLEKYEERLDLLTGFRLSLENVIKHTKQKKLVIVVDELDRCRPTFAIQTLEIAKHLFAVPNLVFIFALDIEQLSCSVKTVYGSSMDAAGYLCRFFDYIGKMPNPNRRTFIKLCLEKHRAFTSTTGIWNQNIPEFIDELAKSFNLSLRDIATIVKTYHLMLDSNLSKYAHPQLHHLYLFLISLKYKNVLLYSNFLLSRKHSATDENAYTLVQKYLPNFSFAVKGILLKQLQKLSTEISLLQCDFEVLPSSVDNANREPYTKPIRIETTKNEKRRGVDNLVITTRVKDPNTTRWIHGNSYVFDFDNIFGDVLDYSDLEKWNIIKNLTLGEYYYQKLEMFNFALPADELATKS